MQPRCLGSEASRLADAPGIRGLGNPPRELIKTALLRARMCESLAGRQGVGKCEKFYTVGLFSVLDAMLGIPMKR